MDLKKADQERWGWPLVLGCLLISVLLGRGSYLQIVQGGKWSGTADGNRVAIELDLAPRGIIYDINGQQIVENVVSNDVIIDPRQLTDDSKAKILTELSEKIDIPRDQISEAVQSAISSRQLTVLGEAIGHEQALQVEQLTNSIPGLKLQRSSVRNYPMSEALAHILGYTGKVTDKELRSRPYLVGVDNVGKAGLEKILDEVLHGQHGSIYYEVSADGTSTRVLREVEAVPGEDVRLNLDAEFQQYIYDWLATNLEDVLRRAETEPSEEIAVSVVAIEPGTGAVRALVSWPSYNPNAFSLPAERHQIGDIFSDPRNLLFNRPVDGTFPPGSTIKPLVAAAALDAGLIDRQTNILSTGGIAVGPWQFPDWKSGGHGVTDIEKAIAESVNTFFYAISGGYGDQAGLGVDVMGRYLKEFGWGTKTGIDLPSEAEGLIPTKAWKEKTKNEIWYIGDTYHLGIGQGDVLATPLQVAVATAAIANGGSLISPKLVANQITEKKEIELSPSSLEIAKAGMRQTVNGPTGSGRSLNNLEMELAGKTGTAQVGGSDATHAWFTSFGPYKEPELVMTVLVERAGAGDRIAVPIAGEIWKWWIANR